MIKMIALQLHLCALAISLDMTLVDISDTQQKIAVVLVISPAKQS